MYFLSKLQFIIYDSGLEFILTSLRTSTLAARAGCLKDKYVERLTIAASKMKEILGQSMPCPECGYLIMF